MGFLGLLISAVLCIPCSVPAQDWGSSSGTSKKPTIKIAEELSSYNLGMNSTYRSLRKTRLLLNTLAIYIQYTVGYLEESSGEGFRLARDPSMMEGRYFMRKVAGGVRKIEFAVTKRPGVGFRIYVYASEKVEGAYSPNPDLSSVRTKLRGLLRAVPKQSGRVDLKSVRYETVRLSYVHSDRVIALLKALGYSTVEYSQKAGETIYDKVYTPVPSSNKNLPVVIKLIDTPKTSLMDAPPKGASPAKTRASGKASVAALGGSFLHQLTGGDPLQRLLIAYDEDDPQSLDALIRLIREKIDLPSQQIVIEVLVVEVNTDRLRDIGIDIDRMQKNFEFTFEDVTGGDRPFTFVFDDSNRPSKDSFKSTVKTLLERGEAEVLSSPSVLVLNDRQARIQIGQRIPINELVTTRGGTESVRTTYFPVGIVLNLRPRISEDQTQVTMQVEAIISSLTTPVTTPPGVDNRQVQTFVRVANNTPFIIGGLISHDKSEKSSGIPILSQIPILGAPFQRKVVVQNKKEVIIVLTPHIVPQATRSFSYVIPKDSDRFDSFENQLFQSSYRIRSTDVYDLTFLRESTVLKDLVHRVVSKSDMDPTIKQLPLIAPLLRGEVPGEEILVRRMLWELVRKLRNWEVLDLSRILFFKKESAKPGEVGFNIAWLEKQLTTMKKHKKNTLILAYDVEEISTPEHPFYQPGATLIEETLPEEKGFRRPEYEALLHKYNDRDERGKPLRWSLAIRDAGDITLLKQCLILKNLIELNELSGLDLASFHVGRQLLFPTREALENRFHLADRETAKLFYQVKFYYPAFEQEFNHQTKLIMGSIGVR